MNGIVLVLLILVVNSLAHVVQRSRCAAPRAGGATNTTPGVRVVNEVNTRRGN